MRPSRRRGFSLVEMLVTLAILAALAGAIIPLAKNAVKREHEIELARSLRLMREAIDLYKKMADEQKIEVEDLSTTHGYPPDLATLVKGVTLKQSEEGGQGEEEGSEGRVMKFLRKIPRDPMTRSYEWGLRSYQDDPDSEDWGGENVFDVYTKSNRTALDGSKYRDW